MSAEASSSSKRKAPSSTHAPLNVAAGFQSAEKAGQPGGAPSSSKRTRFNPDPDDVGEGDGDLDIQEQDRKRMQQGRRGRVNTDGYDSDSSVEVGDEDEDEDDDGAGDRGAPDKDRENGKIAGVDEDDEDIFNMQDDGGQEGGGTEGKAKRKKYLELKDIEGQEFDEEEDGADDNDDDDDRDPDLELESDDDDKETQQRAKEQNGHLHDPEAVVQPLPGKKGKRTTKGGEDMGFEIDSFNVKNEMASGKFDEEGNYIEDKKADPHAEHDQWLKGHYSRKSIKAAREAQARRERETRAQEKEKEKEFFDEDECKMRLVSLMRRRETVLQTLQRLGAEAKRAAVSTSGAKLGKKGVKHKQSDQDSDKGKDNGATNGQAAGSSNDAAQASKIKADLDTITSTSSELMSRHGMTSIYDATYESLVGDVRRSGLVRATWDPAAVHDEPPSGSGSGGAAYIYKWSPQYLAAMQAERSAVSASDTSIAADDQVFGPFSTSDLRVWRDAGYFGERGERILLRADNSVGSPWQTWQDLFD